MSKGVMTGAAAITIYVNIPTAIVPHRFFNLAPALKSFPTTIPTFLGTGFCLPLDNWQLEGDNRHGRLLAMAVSELPSYKKPAFLC
jgi:hypothetical protein